MRDEQTEAFEKVMAAQLARTLDIVRFAETKNAALLTFCSAWILGAINLLTGRAVLPIGYGWAFLAALPLFGAAGLICIRAFIPRLLSGFHTPEDDSKSLLYWEHIAEMQVTAYRPAAQSRYQPDAGQGATSGYLDDLGVQIAVNARIAQQKFRAFRLAAQFTFAAFVVLTAPPLVFAGRALKLLPAMP